MVGWGRPRLVRTEAVRDDLEPSPLLAEEALQKIRRPRRAAMRHRKPQVGDAGLEVVLEAGDRARQQRAALAHRMRNLAVKVPTDLWPEFKARASACYQAPSRAIARDLAKGIR